MQRPLFVSITAALVLSACGQNKTNEALSSFATYGAMNTLGRVPPFTISAVAKRLPNGEVLIMTLRNVSDKPVTISDASLPWVYQNLKIAAVATDGDVVVNSYPIIDTWPSKDVTLLPGEVLSGEYNLRNSLHLSKVNGASDILVMWSYLPVVDGKVLDKITGVALLPKGQQ